MEIIIIQTIIGNLLSIYILTAEPFKEETFYTDARAFMLTTILYNCWCAQSVSLLLLTRVLYGVLM